MWREDTPLARMMRRDENGRRRIGLTLDLTCNAAEVKYDLQGLFGWLQDMD